MERARDGTGEAARRDRVSFWLDSTRDDGHRGSSLPAREAEAVVVGAGIVGLTCALRLAEAGRAVVVVDAGPIAAGVSGYTTAKLTAGHRLCYSRLEGSLGADAAALYARAQTAAIDFVRGLVAERGIDCDLEARPNYVVALDDDELEEVAAETEAARRAGLAAETVTELDVRFPARGATLLPDQAQFHPRAYLLAVARLVEEAGGRLVTGLRVREITGAGPLDVVCDDGAVRAPIVVVATHYPIVEQGFFVPRIHPRRSYVVAAALEEEPPGGMYINVGTPTRSVRTARRESAGRLLLVGGEGHRVGQQADAARRYETLERWMREHFSVGQTAYRWSTQDNYPVDGVPFAGRAGEDEGLFVATGFAGWGMSNGTMAGLAIAAEIEGTPEPWRDLFALARGEGAGGAGRMLRESANVGLQQAAGALRPRRGSPDEIRPGEGAVLSVDGTDVAVSRDRSGTLHSVSPRCTHMGCVLTWNDAESSWDCPCHGSRFDPTGAVLHGPALAPLREVALPAEARR